jgi:hypothetical protein
MTVNNPLNISATGIVSHNGSGVFNGRTITNAGGLTVTNGNGVSGNPSIGITNFVDPSVNNWTVNVVGTTVAGSASYIKQHAVYARLGNIVFFTFDIEWTSHTGSGDMLITGFPVAFAFANSNYPYLAYVENIALPAGVVQVVINGSNGTTQAHVEANINNAVASPVALSTAGTVACYGFYFSDA